jgi:hypothetical protein
VRRTVVIALWLIGAAALPAQEFTVRVAEVLPLPFSVEVAPQEKPRWDSPLEFPDGMVMFEGAKWTQEIAVTNGLDRITKVPRTRLEGKWQVSGGMVGVKGYRSDKYKLLPEAPYSWVGDIAVLNSFGHYQNNRGLMRKYPEGTRFDDVLVNTSTGKVFEHRSRSKGKNGWKSSVLFRDEDHYPRGYAGLKQSCSSCHDQAGTGGYAAGLVPGSDTVISDELNWFYARGYAQ